MVVWLHHITVHNSKECLDMSPLLLFKKLCVSMGAFVLGNHFPPNSRVWQQRKMKFSGNVASRSSPPMPYLHRVFLEICLGDLELRALALVFFFNRKMAIF